MLRSRCFAFGFFLPTTTIPLNPARATFSALVTKLQYPFDTMAIALSDAALDFSGLHADLGATFTNLPVIDAAVLLPNASPGDAHLNFPKLLDKTQPTGNTFE